ncbi:hypothetical protein PENTCL1PPCAC_19470, partial [Pristionchus entomophagus]
CNGLQFTLLKLDKPVPTTPQCIQCEAYLTTGSSHAKHLRRQHKSSMKAKKKTKLRNPFSEWHLSHLFVWATVSSPEVAELRRQLSDVQKKLKGACRIAREAELRAEHAENLLDTKRGIIDGEAKLKDELEETKQKLAVVLSQLEEE